MTEVSKGKRLRKMREFGLAAAFIFPGMLCIFVFKYVMSAQSLIYSFFNYDYVSPPGEFVGIKNYSDSCKRQFVLAAVKKYLYFVGI